MKIYTRTGDDGTTGLIGGGRVSKSDLRIDACGAIDEFNAVLGWAACALGQASGPVDFLSDRLHRVQCDLFVLGSHLAAPDAQAASTLLPELRDDLSETLEREIDEADRLLLPLGCFILPGGTELAARLHVARTICRRAERAVVALHAQHALNPLVVTYLNRLSDWLFTHARLANHLAGVADVPWHRP
jgi:cob(I)alamin adenosyltransferase